MSNPSLAASATTAAKAATAAAAAEKGAAAFEDSSDNEAGHLPTVARPSAS